jgi:two-component system, OmpR family, alkaline phosphatase synthesis response regulator PhoP
MLKEKIFIVEDEENILDLIEFTLFKENYRVKRFASGEEILETLNNEQDIPELILLDIMLPGVDGYEVCKIIKANDRLKDIPIIMLTAKGEEVDIVSGLEIGADDYIIKPFSSRVLTARIKALLRRQNVSLSNEADVICINDLVIHPGRHKVTLMDKNVDLTFSEFRLLQLLAQKRGWVYTRFQIVDALRGTDYPVTERAIDVQVVGLRKKLGSHGNLIETVRGVGYRFKEI